MGFRFRKSIKILPGVKINLSKKGISSVSVGRPGATVNISTDGKTRATVGVPGTGISYQKRLDTPVGKGLTECPFCGHRMRKQWDACPKCGSVLVQEVEQQRPLTKKEIIANMTPEERQAALERGKKKVRRYVIIGAIILGFLIGSCMRDTPKEKDTANNQPQVTQSQQQAAPAKKKSLAAEVL